MDSRKQLYILVPAPLRAQVAVPAAAPAAAAAASVGAQRSGAQEEAVWAGASRPLPTLAGAADYSAVAAAKLALAAERAATTGPFKSVKLRCNLGRSRGHYAFKECLRG